MLPANQKPVDEEPRYVDVQAETNDIDYDDIPANQNEAGGVAFTELFTPSGFRVSLTERRKTGIRALDAIMSAIDYGIRKYSVLGRKPDNTPLQQVPQDDSQKPLAQVIQAQPKVCAVKSIKYIKSKSNKFMLIVSTAEYPDGALAFDNIVPKSFPLSRLTLFSEYAPPPEMAFCVIESKQTGNRVMEFRATP